MPKTILVTGGPGFGGHNVVIIGTGYVGLTTGVCLASLGHKVICVDKDKTKIEKLNKGIIPIFEPGLGELLKDHRNRISFTQDLRGTVQGGSVVFIAVGTPSLKDGNIDLTYLKKAVAEIAKAMRGYIIIVNKSTVPIGTGEWARKEIARYFKGEFSIVSNPEFLREGTAIKDFLEPDRVVLGLEKQEDGSFDPRPKEIMLDIYSSVAAPKLLTDIKSAELIKYASNAFLATKISFINEMANICDRTGGDVKEIAKGIGGDKRIGPQFLNAGLGYGGSCFPKDVDGLISIAKNFGYELEILKAVNKVNKRQRVNFANSIKKVLKKIKGETVCIWGLSFKPNTDDIREAPAMEIIKALQKAGYKIQVYDPIAMENAKKDLPKIKIKFCESAKEAAKGADVLALVTEWPEFSEIDMSEIIKVVRNPIIIDGRNLFEPQEMRKIGFEYYGIGKQ